MPLVMEANIPTSYGWLNISFSAGDPYINLRCGSHEGDADICLTPPQAQRLADELYRIIGPGQGQLDRG